MLIQHLLKKTNLDPTVLNNFRLIYKILFSPKVLGEVASSQLLAFNASQERLWEVLIRFQSST